MTTALTIFAAIVAALAIGCLLVSIAKRWGISLPALEPDPLSALPETNALDMYSKALRSACQQLRDIRKAKHITKKELALAIGHCDTSHITVMESGTRTPTLSFLCRVASALGVRIKVEVGK